ncbi:MAG: RNB domain-containing ribonuclease, partial [Patescibacteria group bacterium]|nr:RNB domain-containing ribonuclease [Patescibacteria group bacterium]
MQEINFPIYSNFIKKKYNKNTLALSSILSRTNTKKEDIKGRKFKQGITIDDISSRDLDDGIWAYKHDYGYVVEVSIADVSEIVKFNSPLDIEALERSTSVYYNTHALFMLPEDITVNKLSLNNNTTKLTLTVTINLDLDFNVVDSFIEETIFHNRKR